MIPPRLVRELPVEHGRLFRVVEGIRTYTVGSCPARRSEHEGLTCTVHRAPDAPANGCSARAGVPETRVHPKEAHRWRWGEPSFGLVVSPASLRRLDTVRASTKPGVRTPRSTWRRVAFPRPPPRRSSSPAAGSWRPPGSPRRSGRTAVASRTSMNMPGCSSRFGLGTTRLDGDGAPGKLHHGIHEVHAAGELPPAQRRHPEGHLLARP